MSPRIYDCFPFFNELDLLEIRLHELSPVVDRFVIVEAGETFSGKPKPFRLAENLDRFAAFRDKITLLRIDAFPPGADPWERERLQRDKLLEGLEDAGPDDLVMLSDIDEIPRASALAEIRRAPPKRAQVICLELRLFLFFFNLEKRERWLRLGPRILRRAALRRGLQDLRYVRGPVEGFLRDAMRGWKARIGMRAWITRRAIRDAGWHFTWLGGVESVASKAAAIPYHSRLPRNMQEAQVAQEVIRGTVAAKGTEFDIVPLDDSFPAYLRAHLDRFGKHVLGPDGELP